MTKTQAILLLTVTIIGCGQPPAPDEQTAIENECVEMLDVAFACLHPDQPVTDTDRLKCHWVAVQSTSNPACPEVAHEEIACVEAFFASYNQCNTMPPDHEALVSYARVHCPNLFTPAVFALSCPPDFTH